MGRRAGVDIMVSVQLQSLAKDVHNILPGGYFIYDSTKPLGKEYLQNITNIGIPMTEICIQNYTDPRQRLLFKNMVYVGALATLLDMDMSVLEQMVTDQFQGKEKLIAPNVKALHLGGDYLKEHYELPAAFK